MSHTLSLEIGGRILSIEIGKMGKQADGSAFVRYGDTVVFVAATSKKEPREDKPFLPLVVDYRENTYAAGKIPGGFFKREGRPTEREILVSRLIDRPVRSLFPEGYHNETQIVAMLLSADLENEPDTLALMGASAALCLSEIPFTTPIGAVKIGWLEDRYVVNPTAKELEKQPPQPARGRHGKRRDHAGSRRPRSRRGARHGRPRGGHGADPPHHRRPEGRHGQAGHPEAAFRPQAHRRGQAGRQSRPPSGRPSRTPSGPRAS